MADKGDLGRCWHFDVEVVQDELLSCRVVEDHVLELDESLVDISDRVFLLLTDV